MQVPGFVTLVEAAQKIATHAYAGQAKREAEKRVRQRIAEATRKGQLTRYESPIRYRRQELFQWACGIWHGLAQALNFPQDVTVSVGNTPAMTFTPLNFSVLQIPAKYDEVVAVLLAKAQKTAELEDELSKCRTYLAEAETELRRWRDKDKETRAKKSRAGKQGGRGKQK